VKWEVPAGEDYVLLAESFSGPVAIEIAAIHPTNLKALVLSATFVFKPSLFPSSLSFLTGESLFAVEPPQFPPARGVQRVARYREQHEFHLIN
jgi:pimeloyl-ACP methyl ester carboxylesterase